MVLPPPASTRLLTIVAHVDHGKTTLADSLVESNGIISERLAGSIRYLDSLEEEQKRGITMRCSAIGLRHRHCPNPKADAQNVVVHLIDSPGHVDFSAEVTTSLLACDGALLVVDAVEGMCARTHNILREAYAAQLVPVLVINKVDRLCTDLGLGCNEAYMRLRELIESVNAASAAMIRSARALCSDDDNDSQNNESKNDEADTRSSKEEEEEGLWNFEPAKGNVVFCSALHGWGFTVPSLARSLFRSKTVPIKPPVLRQYLFDDVKYRRKDCKVIKWKREQSGADDENMTMFSEFALKPLWDAYEGVSTAAACVDVASGRVSRIKADTPGMDGLLASMQIGSTASVVANNDGSDDLHSNPQTMEQMQRILQKTGANSLEAVLRAMLRRYRPLSDAVLDAACEHCPDPSVASSSIRTRALAVDDFPSDSRGSEAIAEETASVDLQRIQDAVRQCDISPDAPTVAHVCKFVVTDRASVTDSGLPSLRGENGEPLSMIMGLTRVLSGALKSEDAEYFCFGPKHTPGAKTAQKQLRLYLLMGSSFVKVDEIPAGHICAVYGLEDLQLKTVTLCDSAHGMPIRGFHHGLKPLVKVNVEPISASDTAALEKGLMKLALADASVEVMATSKGERLLSCLGEIHLEQSIHDLEMTYCGKEIKLRVSKPIVDFGECTVWFDNETSADFEQFFDDKSPPLRQITIPPYCYEEGIDHAHRGRCRALLSGRPAAISLRVVPLASSVYNSLKAGTVVNDSEDDICALGTVLQCGHVDDADEILKKLLSSSCTLDNNGNVMVEAAGVQNGTYIKTVFTGNGEVYVPPSSTAAILSMQQNDQINNDEPQEEGVDTAVGRKVYNDLLCNIRAGGLVGDGVDVPAKGEFEESPAATIWHDEMRGSIAAGFQLAMRSGPFCEEPVRGVLVVVEGIEIATTSSLPYKSLKPVGGGIVVAALRSGIRCALLSRPARLVEGHLRLTLHSSFTGLGPLHAVLSRRRGKVLTDDMVEGTDLIRVTANLPQAESFHLAPELLKESSGEVTAPELVFSHWGVLEEDPFWIPTSLEEREDFGEILMSGDSSTGIKNNALKYIRAVRDRKGLLVDSKKIVVAAEKQRTLARKK